ncbi:hypothetical protein [Chitinophaga deserti]|uniref:hypothetical protein n=1 Tax=Chitinophaga deserti TaxID=2164099 RepID=UPI0013002F86|nr:hypothetical protein [Chitinophaga deserti]
MYELQNVKAQFEHKSYAVRSDFIDEYDFNDDHHQYYRDFILNKSQHIKDHIYLSDLIDLSGWLNIYEVELQLRWFQLLNEKVHYVIKLAVLDYFKYCDKDVVFDGYGEQLWMLLKKRQLPIVKNQILYNLLLLDSIYAEAAVVDLIASLNSTNDWRSFYRVLSNLEDVPVDENTKSKICRSIYAISKQRDLREGTMEMLKKICNFRINFERGLDGFLRMNKQEESLFEAEEWAELGGVYRIWSFPGTA